MNRASDWAGVLFLLTLGLFTLGATAGLWVAYGWHQDLRVLTAVGLGLILIAWGFAVVDWRGRHTFDGHIPKHSDQVLR